MSGVGVDVVFFLAGIETPPPFVIEKDNKKKQKPLRKRDFS
jgi:hypothetical protein